MDDAARLDRLLVETMLRFWDSTTCDERGGYRLNHDRHSVWLGPAPKSLVTQSRTLWFFSRLLRSPYGTAEHARAARHGLEFLANNLLDTASGGYYWQVDEAGSRATDASKKLYGQAFALYALSECARTLGDAQAKHMADELFFCIETHAHDALHGGYFESFDRSWTLLEPVRKTRNTHLHLLEAITAYYLLSGNAAARDRVHELVIVLSNALMHRGACAELHAADWTVLAQDARTFVSYGHDLETITLLVAACDAIGMQPQLFLPFFRSLSGDAERYGFDRKHGGWYHTGPLHRRARDRTKVWWVQAEALLALGWLRRLTGEKRYGVLFSRTLDWICERQADWERGEWFADVDARGRPSGNKTGPWKGPYHAGRALLETLELLRGD